MIGYEFEFLVREGNEPLSMRTSWLGKRWTLLLEIKKTLARKFWKCGKKVGLKQFGRQGILIDTQLKLRYTDQTTTTKFSILIGSIAECSFVTKLQNFEPESLNKFCGLTLG